jgi:hypothetical protein
LLVLAVPGPISETALAGAVDITTAAAAIMPTERRRCCAKP